MKKNMKKMKLFFLSVVAIFLVVYLVMFLSTNAVMRELERVFLLEVVSEETAGRAIDFFNEHDRIGGRNMAVGDVYLRLRRTSVWHNFRTGYVRIVYTTRVSDEEGRLLWGSSGVLARLRIQRVNGAWEIVEVCDQIKGEYFICYP